MPPNAAPSSGAAFVVGGVTIGRMSGSIKLRGGYFSKDERLDRLPSFDERSRRFPIAAVVPEALTRGRTWYQRTWLDQGQEGACVSFAWHHDAASSPVVCHDLSNGLAHDRYWEMQRRDEWPGGAYPGASPQYGGTSVLAGAQLMRELGYFAEYRWAFSIDEVLLGIVHEGPCVFGIPWLDSMFAPDPKTGLLDCSGSEVGGHAIQGRGVSLKPTFIPAATREPVVRVHNSWGRDWGKDGDAFIRVSDLEQLMKSWGECCFPIDRKLPAGTR